MSVLRGFLVLRVRHREEVLQLPLEGLEGGSLHRVLNLESYIKLIMKVIMRVIFMLI